MKFNEILPEMMKGKLFSKQNGQHIYRIKNNVMQWIHASYKASDDWELSIMDIGVAMLQHWEPYEEPKPGVKKWQWATPDGSWTTTGFYTDRHSSCTVKLPWTEMEFDV